MINIQIFIGSAVRDVAIGIWDVESIADNLMHYVDPFLRPSSSLEVLQLMARVHNYRKSLSDDQNNNVLTYP